jgi:hypothetical protein
MCMHQFNRCLIEALVRFNDACLSLKLWHELYKGRMELSTAWVKFKINLDYKSVFIYKLKLVFTYCWVYYHGVCLSIFKITIRWMALSFFCYQQCVPLKKLEMYSTTEV